MLHDFNMPLPITELCNIATNCKTDKAKHGYTRIYYELFKSMRYDGLNILEIGVRKGYSLKMWSIFFPNSNVYGIDIKPLDINNCYRADQKDYGQMMAALDYFNLKSLDIVIDDGSHFQSDQQKSLEILFPYLRSGGYYIIEDVATKEQLLKGANWGSNVSGALDSTDTLFTNYCNHGFFDSYYISEKMNKYISASIKDAFIFNELNKDFSPINGTSKLVVIEKI